MNGSLDDGCEVLQQVLVSDVPGPQVKLNVGQLEASKRKKLIMIFFILKLKIQNSWMKKILESTRSLFLRR